MSSAKNLNIEYNEDSPDKGIAEIIVRKQRDGPLGTVFETWLGQYCLFENYVPERYQRGERA
jgi:replicative DNA helicase